MKNKTEDTQRSEQLGRDNSIYTDLFVNNWNVENLENAQFRFCDLKFKIHNNTDFWRRLTLSDVDL